MEQNIFLDQKIWRWGPVKGWVITADFPCTGILVRMPKYTGYEWAAGTLLMNQGEMIWTQNWLPMVEASTRAFYGVMMSPEKRSEIAKSYDAVVGELRAYAKLVYRDGVSDLTDEVLIEQFASWREQVMDFWAWASPGECATFGGEEEIRLAVEANWSGREVAEIMEVLTAPIALSFFQDAELNLLERVLECENESQALQEHVTNFYWLDNGYYGSRRRTEIEAKKMLDSLLEDHGSLQEAIDSIRNYEQALFSRRAALKEKYKIDDVIKEGDTEFQKQLLLMNCSA